MNTRVPLTCACEPLEDRIAPAAMHTFISANKVTYVDPDGDLVTVSSSVPAFTAGLGQFTWVASGHGEQLQKLSLPVTAAGTKLSITATPSAGLGDGFVNVGTIDAGKIDVSSITVQGDVVKILAGDSKTTTPAIGSLKLQSMGRFGTSTQDVADPKSVIKGAVGKMFVASDVKGVWFDVTGTGATSQPDGIITSLTIGGSLIGGATSDTGEISATGGFGTVSIKGSIVGGAGSDSGRIAKSGSDNPVGTGVSNFKSLFVGGSIVGGSGPHSGEVESTGNILSAKIVGNLEGGASAQTGRIEVTKDLPTLTIGGSVIGGRHTAAGEIIVGGTAKKIAITGSILGGDNATTTATPTAISETGYIQAGHIGAVTIGGSIVAGTVSGTGTLDKSGSIRSANEIGSIAVLGDLRGNATANVSITAKSALPGGKLPAIGAITVGGTVERANILAGYDTTTVASDGTASIGKVSVLGDWVASNLIAGFDAGGDGKFGTSDDTRIGTPAIASKIASITILGQVSGTPANSGTPGDPVNSDSFAFEASNIGAIKLGAVTLPLSAALNTDLYLLSYTTNHDVVVKETFV